ncbi:MAG TPA: CHAT domain-containing protein [Oscillatoriaceae cyanobacterium M7585_C2015_266]|nr:CHAT domain-containing protein [Oscillatoriaceae cyanobacterium M7585_C2015_266]
MNMPYKPGVAIASGTLEATGRNINILGATRKANAINPKAATVTMAPEITLNTDRGNILINSMKNNPDGIFSPPPLQPPPPPPPTGARIGQQFVQLQKQPPQQVTVVNNTGNVGNVPNVQIAIAELEQRRHQEFSNYFGANLSKYFTNTTNVREALVEIYHQTKNRSAIVYVTALPDELELILYAAKTHPIRKTIPQAKRDKLMKVVAEFHYSLTAPHYRTTTNYLQPAQQLYQWLITPIEEELRANSIDTILFSMDAGLRSLPVAALHDGQQFLVEKYSLALIPSISLVDSRYKSLEDAKILAMGASNFSIFAPSLSPLPAVPVELSAITQQREGIILLNEEFTLNNLKSQRSKYPFEIIHLATHGEFKPGDMSKSYIQLWKEKLQLDQMRSLGFNNPPVELLVLSACQTAVGDERAELGFAGFAVAAGVKTALASLWYVSDEGTLALMSEFYSQLKNAKIKAEALRQAQVAMSRGEVKVEGGYLRSVGIKDRVPLPPELANKLMINLSHPYYWSAFTMIGSPW